MSPTAPPAGTDLATWERATYAVARKMREAYPSLGTRLDSAIVLVRDQAVTLDAEGVAQVASRSTPGQVWRVNGHCPCPDAQHNAPDGRCAHRIAVALYRRVLQVFAAEAPATQTPIPEPEVVQASACTPVAEVVDAEVPHETPAEPTPLLPALRPIAALEAPEDLAQAIDAWTRTRALLSAYIRQNLREGTDYYSLKIGSRETAPSLSKAGSEKFLSLFQLQASFRKDDDTWEMLGCPPGVLCYVCTLTTASGQIVGEGRGARDIKKDGGDINKAIKMAEKSSQIDAVLRTGALSDQFTQDLGPDEQHRP